MWKERFIFFALCPFTRTFAVRKAVVQFVAGDILSKEESPGSIGHPTS